MRQRHRILAALAAAAGLIVAAMGGGYTFAAFTSQSPSPNNRVTAAPDFRAPTVSASVIGKSTGGTAGYIKQGASYHVYANATDSGNPASGIASVSADLSSIDAGVTAAPLVAGSYSVDEVSYSYRSSLLTADNPLSEGSKPYTLTAVDNASNSATESGFGVIVDNTPPAPTDVQTTNNTSIVGRAEINDTITFNFSEPVDPSSILAGWNGSATNVVVRLTNTALAGADRVEIYNAPDSAALPFGSVGLGGAFYVGGVLGGEIARFGATGTPSTMVVSQGQITIRLGTASGQAATTSLTNTTMTWQPSTTPTDRAGNASTNPATTESGQADMEF